MKVLSLTYKKQDTSANMLEASVFFMSENMKVDECFKDAQISTNDFWLRSFKLPQMTFGSDWFKSDKTGSNLVRLVQI